MSQRPGWHRTLNGRKWQGRRHRHRVLPDRPLRMLEGPVLRHLSISRRLQWSTVASGNSNGTFSKNGTLSDSNFARNANVS
jgi:hypothetical protein